MFKKTKKRVVSALVSVALLLSATGCTIPFTDKEANENNTTSFTTEGLFEDGTTNETLPTTTPVYEEYIEEKVSPDSPEAKKEQERFDKFTDEIFEKALANDTLSLHYLISNPKKMGIEVKNITLGDFYKGESDFQKNYKDGQEEFSKLKSFNYELLTTDQQFTYDLIYFKDSYGLESFKYPYFYEPFAQISGIQVNLPITLSEYVFYNKSDVDIYLELMSQVPDYFDQCLNYENDKIKKGMFMSDNSANEVIKQCNEFIKYPEKNLLIETFDDRIDKLEGLSASEAATYKKKNKELVMQCIIPTYQKTISAFSKYRGTGTNDLGICYFENGKEYFKHIFATKVGTSMTVDEAITLLDSELEASMKELTSYAMKHYADISDYTKNYENLYKDVDANETILIFEDKFKDRFPALPEINFTVSPVHDSLVEIASPAFYMLSPIDAYEQNVIHTNMESDGAGSLWSTLAHEGFPGHMLQHVYFLSTKPSKIRTAMSFSGYSEGWASYVQTMSFDYYDFPNEAYAVMEKTDEVLNLLVSTRVDIGVNYEGWTVEDTKNYLNKNGLNGSVAEKLLNYVAAEPGNYCEYCIGWLQIKNLREHAEGELGEKFSEKNFHKVILEAGPCDFDSLEKKVDKYIDATK